MTSELAREDWEAALDRCVSDVLWEAGTEGPPVNAFAVAERLGFVVAQDEALQTRGRFARLAGGSKPGGVILLGAEPRSERRQWAVAHEIGEGLAKRVFDFLGYSPSDARQSFRESVANALASRLLLPTDWFRDDARECDHDLITLKSLYRTASHELISRRLLDTAGGATMVTVLDQGEVTWRRSSVSAIARGFYPVERAAWQECHDTARAFDRGLADGPIERVRCWPIHEPGWRREIMLTEFVMFDEPS